MQGCVPPIPKRVSKDQSSETDPRIGLLLAQNPYYTRGNALMRDTDTESTDVNIVLGNEDSNNEMIPLGVRQPSFRSIGSSLILKGGSSFKDSGVAPAPVPPSGRLANETTKNKTIREKMQSSMESMNRNVWKEIGYNPSEIGTTK